MSRLSDERQELIREIKEKNDIVSVISEYVSLRRAGRVYSGLCPFHSEKTPSFNVNPEKQFFYCFGCGTGGDVISFLMKLENMDFVDAAKHLAERAGITWVDNKSNTDEQKDDREQLYRLNKLAASFYQQCLQSPQIGQAAREYLERRGIAREIQMKFMLGFAPTGWNNLDAVLRKKNADLQLAESIGLLSFGERGFYDRFRERLIFPIADARGNILGFGGRVFDNSQPKYLNSPDTRLFHKGYNLYGLNVAKDTIRRIGQAVFMEGYMDVVQAHQAGFTQTVASLGTALTADQVKLIKRYVNEVVLAYDSDNAGRNATLKGVDLFQSQGVRVKVISLPDGHDPDSYIREFGREAFAERLEQAMDLLDFRIDRALKQNNIVTAEGKSAVVREVLPDLAKLTSVVARDDYVRHLARDLGVNENSIMQELRRWRQQTANSADRNGYVGNNNPESSADNHYIGLMDISGLSALQKSIFKVEKELLQFTLQEYNNFERIKEQLQPEQLSFEVWKQLFINILVKNPSAEEYDSLINEMQTSLREVAASILAESEVRSESQPLDPEILLQRLEMLHLKERVQQLTEQVSIGKNNAGEPLTEDELKQKVTEFVALKKELQSKYPNFGAEI